MKRLFVCLFIVAALVVTYNVRTRIGTPVIAFAHAAPWLHDHPFLEDIAAHFCKPGTTALWYLGFELDTPWQLGLDFLMSWYAWLFCARTLVFLVGLKAGAVPLSSFHWWTKFWLPWRLAGRIYLKFCAWRKQLRYGDRRTACWMSLLGGMVRLYRGGDQVPLGRLWWKGFGLIQPVAAEGTGHVAVVAKTGAGKTTWGGWYLKNIPRDGSAIAIDVDGELANTVGVGLEADGHPIQVLDPYGLSDYFTCHWNPFDEFAKAIARHNDVRVVVRLAQVLADALIPEMNQMQQIFTRTARRFLCGLILFVWLFEPPERRNLVRVRQLMAQGYTEAVTDPAKQSAHEALLLLMQRAPQKIDDGCNGEITSVIASAAESLKTGKNREGGNPFLSTALTATAWIEIPELAATLLKSDFSLEDLKLGNVCVFIVAPVIDIRGVLNGWVRAISMMTFYVFENIIKHLKTPCLFFMDEAPSLKIEYLDTVAPVARRHGIRLVVIFQDIPLLKSAYPETWATFIANALVYILMFTDDLETLKHACELCGQRSVRVQIDGPHWIWRLFGLSKEKARHQWVDKDLITVDQLREFLNRSRGQIVSFIAGEPAIRVALEGYITALAVWEYAASKHYREKLLRAWTRHLLAKIWLRVEPTFRHDPKKKTTPRLPR